MKMFKFETGGYCEAYHVMAENKEKALQYIKEYCIDRDCKRADFKILESGEIECSSVHYITRLPLLKFASLNEYLHECGYHYKNWEKYMKYPEYCEEYSEGQVVQTETA